MPSRDFTRKHEPIWFTIEPERYDCYAVLPMDDLQSFAETIGTEVTVANILDKIKLVMELVMQPESYQRFVARMANRQDPVDPRQLMDIAEWLAEVYTNRPTGQPSNSSSGSPDAGSGSSSTAGAPETASILGSSIPSDSPI